jgi:NADPH-dependent 2,4-dienoyl-CoA reductase/sulfur reductase-like enzyme
VTRTVAVVGASLAGLSAGRALREQGFDGRVLLIGDEPHAPYDRPPLSKEFLAGTCPREDLDLAREDDAALDFEWMVGQRAVALDPRGRSLRLAHEREIRADGVVLATGARARRLPGPGNLGAGNLSGVHVLRTLEDAVALRSDLRPGRRLVVIGAGFIGAEVASTARGLGIDVTVVEALPVPLEGPLGPAMGRVCASLHADHGTRLLTGTGVARLDGDDRVTAVQLLDGRRLPADVVVVGIGAQPNVEWLEGSGLELRGGIATDARGVTSIPGVVAVGDCGAPWCETPWSEKGGRHVRAEHWTHALEQPAAAVAALLGTDTAPSPFPRGELPPFPRGGLGGSSPWGELPPRLPYFWSDQYGVRIQFAGTRSPDDKLRIVDGDVGSRSFVALYERDEVPVAVLGMNQPRLFTRWRRQLHAAATV